MNRSIDELFEKNKADKYRISQKYYSDEDSEQDDDPVVRNASVSDPIYSWESFQKLAEEYISRAETLYNMDKPTEKDESPFIQECAARIKGVWKNEGLREASGTFVQVKGIIRIGGTGGHPPLAGWDGVLCAGNLTFDECGTLLSVGTHSGHFKPFPENGVAFLCGLGLAEERVLDPREIRWLMDIPITVYKTYGNELQGLEESTITLADVARNGLEGAQRNISVTYNNALPQKAINFGGIEDSFSTKKSTKRWENDNDVRACRICGRQFIFLFLHRHHCRRCGKIICNNCSPSKRLLNEVYTEDYPAGRTLKKPEMVRVCRNCEG